VSAKPAKRDARGTSPATERRGGLGGFLAPRPVVDVGMPSMRSSFVRGVAAALSSPLVVIAVPVLVLVEWLAAVAAGFQGPFVVLAHALALPPVGTATDLSVAARATTGAPLAGIGIAILARAVVLALVGAASVQAVRDGRVTRWVWVPALKALPACLAVSIASVSLLFAAQLFGAFLGGVGGFGLFLQIGAFVLGVSYFGYVPAIATTEDRRLTDVLSRAWRAARIPGSSALTLAAIYVIPSLAVLFSAPVLPGGNLGVNPSVGAWVLVILVNLVHVSVSATLAYRYLSVADVVPEPPARPARPAARTR
jgi:hypothetical protein